MEMDGWIETTRERPQHTPVYIMYPELALDIGELSFKVIRNINPTQELMER